MLDKTENRPLLLLFVAIAMEISNVSSPSGGVAAISLIILLRPRLIAYDSTNLCCFRLINRRSSKLEGGGGITVTAD